MPDHENCGLIYEKLEVHARTLERHSEKINMLENEREKSDEVLNGLRQDFIRFATSIETSVKSMSTFIKIVAVLVPAIWALLTHFHVSF